MSRELRNNKPRFKLTSLSKKKRFLFVIGLTCPFPGAGWWRLFNFAKWFRRMGHKCYVLSSFSPRSINCPKVLREEGIYIYNVLPSIMLNNPFFMILNNILAFIVSIPFFLLTKPDVVIISIPPVNQFFSTFILSRCMRCKLVIDYRDEFEDYLAMRTEKWSFFYRFLKEFLTYFYRKATIVVSVTPAVAKGLVKRGIYNVKVIHDGVDTTIFRPFDQSKVRVEFNVPQESFVIAYLGIIYKPYRVDIVIKALKKLNHKNPKQKYLLILVGGGKVESILNLARNLGISDSVKYFGVIKNPAKIAKILSSADCGIIPYDDNPLWQKTYSTKLFEYCAVGLPVIGTVHENSALASIIKANKMGLITPPLDVEKLAMVLEMLSSNKKLRAKMRSNALCFSQKYDKKRLAMDLLKTILRRNQH